MVSIAAGVALETRNETRKRTYLSHDSVDCCYGAATVVLNVRGVNTTSKRLRRFTRGSTVVRPKRAAKLDPVFTPKC